tara:strand:- start:213 stop:509 length:297 start_codon:yes stop_codon:yes gene_type:complete
MPTQVPETQSTNKKRFACDGGDDALGHPRIWLQIPEPQGGSNVPTAIVNTYIKMILPQSPDMKMRQCGLSMIPAVIQLCRVQHCRRGNALSEQARPEQ